MLLPFSLWVAEEYSAESVRQNGIHSFAKRPLSLMHIDIFLVGFWRKSSSVLEIVNGSNGKRNKSRFVSTGFQQRNSSVCTFYFSSLFSYCLCHDVTSHTHNAQVCQRPHFSLVWPTGATAVASTIQSIFQINYSMRLHFVLARPSLRLHVHAYVSDQNANGKWKRNSPEIVFFCVSIFLLLYSLGREENEYFNLIFILFCAHFVRSPLDSRFLCCHCVVECFRRNSSLSTTAFDSFPNRI